MTVNEVVEILAARGKNLQLTKASVRELSFDRDSIIVRGAPLLLTNTGIKDLCSRLSAPFSYISKLEQVMRGTVFSYHLRKGDLGDAEADVSAVSRDGEFLRLDDPELVTLPGTEVLQAVIDGQDPTSLTVQNFRLIGESFELDLLNQNCTAEVAVGDVVRAGLHVTHSLVGEHATWVESFIFRLVCSNGMTHRDCVSRKGARTRRLPIHLPRALDLQRAQVRRLASDAWAALDKKLDHLRRLQQERVEVERLLRRSLERARLSTDRLLPLLRDAWSAEGAQPTLWAAINALTSVATHGSELSFRRRRVLSGLAGVLAFRSIHLCPRCFTALSGSADADEPSSNRE